MNERLKEIIRYKTGGRQVDFATLCGWTPQYVAKLLRGDNFGLAPVKTILALFPDIDARWLLFGEGDMLTQEATAEIYRRTQTMIQGLLDLEKYLPVMTAEELRYFERSVQQGCQPDFSPTLLSELDCRATERQQKINAKFSEAQAKSTELCKHRTANK